MKQVEIVSASFHPFNFDEKLKALVHIQGKVNGLLEKDPNAEVTWLQSSGSGEAGAFRFTQLTAVVGYAEPDNELNKP